MVNKNSVGALAGRCIALPEMRQLDVLAGLLERRGARVLRCPLIAILDTPDQVRVTTWLRRFIDDSELRDLILLTGEGVRRLLAASERAGLREKFVSRLAQVRKIARGPKPGRALREVGLASDVVAPVPTTAGVIDALESMQIDSGCVAVQLYGSEPNQPLQTYLRARNIEAVTVAPYIYADASDERRVMDLIDNLSHGNVDAIAFTSQPQIRRLFAVARAQSCEAELRKGLTECKVAAVGPVVTDCLTGMGVGVDASPEAHFYMRPLVDALMACLPARGV